MRGVREIELDLEDGDREKKRRRFFGEWKGYEGCMKRNGGKLSLKRT